MYQNNNTIREDILKKYIEEIFNLYDPQRTGNLNASNITNFFNDLFRSVEVQITLAPQQTYEAIRIVYPNYTNLISKEQLFVVFKVMLGIANQPQNQQQVSINQFQGYNPAMMNNGNFNPQGYYGTNNIAQNYMQYNQNQSFMMAQNMMRQSQGQQISYPQGNMNGYIPNNGNNGQNRR